MLGSKVLVKVFPPTIPVAVPNVPVNIFAVFIVASCLNVPLYKEVPKLLVILREKFANPILPAT